MCVLNDLVPFVRFAQFVGLFPFDIKKNSLNGRIERFSFSWRHLITYWFVLVLVFQIVPLVIGVWVHNDLQREFNTFQLPLIFTIPIYTTIVVHYVMVAVSRSATLRHHQLNLIVKYLNSDAIRELEDMTTAGYKNVIKRKTSVGVCLILITVRLCNKKAINY